MTKKRQILIVFVSTLLLGIGAFALVILLAAVRHPVQSPHDAGSLAVTGAFLASVGAVLVLIIPFVFLAMYFLYGREKEPLAVPEFLSTIPDKNLSPLQVNILFSGSPWASDENGFYATLLDLHRRKKIELIVKPDKRGVLIRVLERSGTDAYEQRVMDFFSQFMSGNVFDSGFLAKTASGAPDNWEPLLREMDASEKTERQKKINRAKTIQRQLNTLMFRTDDALTEKYLSNGTVLTIPFITTGFVFFFGALGMLLNAPAARVNEPVSVLFGLAGLCIAASVLVLYSSLGKYGDDRIRMNLEKLPLSSDDSKIRIRLPAPDAVIRTLKVDRPFPIVVVIATECVLALLTVVTLAYDPSTPVLVYAIATLLGLVILIQSTVAYYYALTIFSRWNEDHYREKLEWLSFSKFLSGLPGIEKYDPENLDQWGEWVVYGTALGLGEKIGIAATLIGLDLYYPYPDDPAFPWFGDFQTMSEFAIDKQ
jgi:uncharacterized membrane protein